jgi:hypothetical protein
VGCGWKREGWGRNLPVLGGMVGRNQLWVWLIPCRLWNLGNLIEIGKWKKNKQEEIYPKEESRWDDLRAIDPSKYQVSAYQN